MNTVAITGASGAIGQRLLPALLQQYNVEVLYHDKPYPLGFSSTDSKKIKKIQIDLLNKKSIQLACKKMKAKTLIHLAAYTHIDRCELDKKNGEHGVAWKLNVEATKHLAEYCAANKIRFIALSTECVFDGKKPRYTEIDQKTPINWYGYTKAKAEDLIEGASENYAILRSVVAFHEQDHEATIFGRFLKEIDQHHKSWKVVNDRWFSPTYTNDIVAVLLKLIESEHNGIFHFSSPTQLSPFEFACKIAKKVGVPLSKIKPGKAEDLLGKRKAKLRLEFASLSSNRVKKLYGIEPTSINLALAQMKL